MLLPYGRWKSHLPDVVYVYIGRPEPLQMDQRSIVHTGK